MRLLGFESTIALRFLREGRYQSALIIVGVAAGVAVVAYISALITGLQANTIRRTLGAQAHLTIKAPEDRVLPVLPRDGPTIVLGDVQPRAQRLRSVENWQALVRSLDRDPALSAVSPIVTGSALAVRGEAGQSVAIFGVEIERYDRIVSLRERISAGRLELNPGDAMIGVELAADLGVRVGDRFNVTTARDRRETFRVTALLDFGVRDLNRRTVVVALRAAQSLLDLSGGVTQVDATVHDLFAAEDISQAIRQRTGLDVRSWMQTNAQLLSALKAQAVSTGVIRVVVMIVVLLGISSVLVVAVVQKQREIGILRAMGAGQGQILRVFLIQGLIIGFAGSVIGAALAWLLVLGFTSFVRGADGAPLFVIEIAPALFAQIAIGASLAGMLAAVLPARRAARLDPAQAIRI
ncbi:MAG: ABC transporter permease [Lautropia sp.]